MENPKRSTRKILLCTHPVLRRKATTVKRMDKAIRRLLDEMVETMQAAPGLGLAAPQVGESLRCAVVAAPDEEVRKLVNPRIVARADKIVGPEGCLSLPTLQARVPRAREITVRALDEKMRPHTSITSMGSCSSIGHSMTLWRGKSPMTRSRTATGSRRQQ